MDEAYHLLVLNDRNLCTENHYRNMTCKVFGSFQWLVRRSSVHVLQSLIRKTLTTSVLSKNSLKTNLSRINIIENLQ